MLNRSAFAFLPFVAVVSACAPDAARDADDAVASTESSLAATLVAYDNGALVSPWTNNSWSVTLALANTTPLYGTKKTMKATFKPWGAICLIDGNVSVAAGSYDTFDFYVNGGTNVAPKLKAQLYVNNTWGPEVVLAPYCTGGVIPKNAWTRCAVPVAALGGATSPFNELVIGEYAGKTLAAMYFSTIEFSNSAPPPVAVTVTPTTASVWAGATQQFTAAVTGSTNTSVTWAVTEAGGGTVGATGLYTAPADPGVFHVVATAVADATKTATATVTVPQVAVTVSPSTATVTLGATRQFSASVTGTTNSAVTWSVTGAGCGTISPTGLFSGTASGTCSVVATSVANATKSAVAAVTVPQVTVAVSPASATVDAGGTRQFTAAVANATNTGVTWSLSDPGCGTIDAAGLFRAGPLAATCSAVATAVADPARSAAASITIPTLVVTIAPSTAALLTGASQQFTATVTGAANPVIVWSVDDPACGQISSTGLFTAGGTAAICNVVALEIGDPGRPATAASAPVSVSLPPVEFWITPASASLLVGTSQQFVATVTGLPSPVVTWSVADPACGTIGLVDGLFTAGAAAGNCLVTATEVSSAPNRTTQAAVTVTVPQPVAVSVAPASVTISTGATQQLVATVTGSTTTTVTWAVTEGASCGSISAGGLFTAGSSDAVCHVVATADADATASATSTVTVVVPPPPVAVSLTPASASILGGATQAFLATVTGSANTSVTWSVVESGCGSVSSSGLYTAAASAGTCHVAATSVVDTTKSALATVTVSVPAPPPVGRLTRISVGKPAYASEGTSSLLTDGAYRSPNAWTFTKTHCTVSTPCWAAVNVGAGPTRVLVDWSYQDGGGDFDTRVYGGTTVRDYAIQVSADSTNGNDGVWTTATDSSSGSPVTVTANQYIQRSHLVEFTGYRWVRIRITSTTANEIDELDVWDASATTNDSYLFHGDSITLRCMNMRGSNVNYGNQPSFQTSVSVASPERYPLQVGAGIVGEGVSEALTEVASYLPLFKPVRYWFLTMGTNDRCGSGGTAAFKTSAQGWINAVKAAGGTPVLVHPIWGNNISSYCSQNGPAYNTAVDELVAANALSPAVPMYEVTVGHPEYFDNNDVHPNAAGCEVWNRTLADAVASPPCIATCAAGSCGSNGCGGTCACDAGLMCQAQVCVCAPQCSGKNCGADGCGGSCGTCTQGNTCSAAGTCTPVCVPSCSGKACGSDGCGGSCGTCASGTSCNASGACVAACVPACDGKTCGDDGCGGSCGSCASGSTCNASGQCIAGCVAPWSPLWSQTTSAGAWWAEFFVEGGSLPKSVSLQVVGGTTYPLALAWGKWSGGIDGVNSGTSVILRATDATGATAKTVPFRYLVDTNPATDACGGTPSTLSSCTPLTRGMLTITMDDSYDKQYTLAAPILAKYGAKATIYHISNTLQNGGYMTPQMAVELAAAGHEIADHTKTHSDLTTLSAQAVDDELRLSKEWITANVGSPVLSFASPLGNYNANVITSAKRYFTSHRTVNPGLNYVGSDLFQLNADNIDNTATVATVCAQIAEAATKSGWRMLIFHEFTTATTASSTYTYPISRFDSILACAKATAGLDIVTTAQGVAKLACASP